MEEPGRQQRQNEQAGQLAQPRPREQSRRLRAVIPFRAYQCGEAMRPMRKSLSLRTRFFSASNNSSRR